MPNRDPKSYTCPGWRREGIAVAASEKSVLLELELLCSTWQFVRMAGRRVCVSPEGATDCSPGRKPGVGSADRDLSPSGATEVRLSVAPSRLESRNSRPRAYARGYNLPPLRGSIKWWSSRAQRYEARSALFPRGPLNYVDSAAARNNGVDCLPLTLAELGLRAEHLSQESARRSK